MATRTCRNGKNGKATGLDAAFRIALRRFVRKVQDGDEPSVRNLWEVLTAAGLPTRIQEELANDTAMGQEFIGRVSRLMESWGLGGALLNIPGLRREPSPEVRDAVVQTAIDVFRELFPEYVFVVQCMDAARHPDVN